MHSLQPQQNAQLRPRGHDENILEEAYRGRYARQRLLNFWPESSCGYHAIKRFVCIIQVTTNHPGKILNMSASARWPGVVQEKRSHRQNTPNITPNTQNSRGAFRSTLLTVLLTSPR